VGGHASGSRDRVVTGGHAAGGIGQSQLARQAVQTYWWLTAGDILHGLALAETTPGPLIMGVQFVAFLGASRTPARCPCGPRP
jgi:hypothetical protein